MCDPIRPRNPAVDQWRRGATKRIEWKGAAFDKRPEPGPSFFTFRNEISKAPSARPPARLLPLFWGKVHTLGGVRPYRHHAQEGQNGEGFKKVLGRAHTAFRASPPPSILLLRHLSTLERRRDGQGGG